MKLAQAARLKLLNAIAIRQMQTLTLGTDARLGHLPATYDLDDVDRDPYAHLRPALTYTTAARFHAALATWENRMPDERPDELIAPTIPEQALTRTPPG